MKRFFMVLMCLVLLSGCAGGKISKEQKNLKNEIRAVWVSVYDMSQFQGISEGGFRGKVENMFRDIEERGFQHVFLQVRPYSDALYKSEIFPWSKYISGLQGKSPGYDPLIIFLDVAHSHNLKLHAWINPYRISAVSSEMEFLSDMNPAKIMHAENKGDVYFGTNGIYYNPASVRVQKLILDGVREIVKNYDIDGIHIDDFFYPTTDKEIDEKEYEEYKKNSGKLSLTEFRREQVNAFVSGMYSIAKSEDKSIIVSISPSADIENNMNTLYADVKLWSKEDGFCDWIIPQLYYGFKNETMPYEKVVEEWRSLVTNEKIKLVIGLASYKCGETDFYAGKGKDEWKTNDDVLSEQLKFLRKKDCDGFSVFSYGSLTFPNSVMENEWSNLTEQINASS